jgi:Tfp pilus assembly protein PilE
MAVVVITAILSVAGVAVFRKYIISAKGGEALSTIQAIRAAEEAYMAENHVYKNVSTAVNWYPNLTPNQVRTSWPTAANPTSHVDSANWLSLAPAVNRTVQFGYLANAGQAGDAIPAPQGLNTPAFAAPLQSWYLLQAEGDCDGDGIYANYASTSMTGEIYSEREGE